MEKQGRKESNIQQPPWIPQTPMKPTSPICSNTVEEQAYWNQVEERRFAGNKDMSGLDHLSFGDLLALANTASLCFSGQAPKPTKMMQNDNEVVESLSSVSNNVAEQIIKTPIKPKRKKYRPKVIREAKPKREPKTQTPRKSVVADGQESKTPRRKYVQKKV